MITKNKITKIKKLRNTVGRTMRNNLFIQLKTEATNLDGATEEEKINHENKVVDDMQRNPKSFF